MCKYVMGIDNGGTSTKAVIFDVNGNEIASAKENTVMIQPKPGHTERDMESLWQTNARVIREAIKKAEISPEEIIGVSFSGHGKGLYLWGHDEKPTRNGIISTDSRANSYVERWNKDGTSDKAFEMTCQSVLACQPVALLNWIKDNEPGVLENTKWIFGVKDYIRYRMTGQAYGEITDLSGSSLVNLKSASYDPAILELFGLDIAEKLPPLVYSSEICGHVTGQSATLCGLAPNTPVAAGLFDIDACAIAMDITTDEKLAVIAGTWSINEYIQKKPVLDRSIKMNSLYCLSGYYLCEECSPTSASNLEWFINNLADGNGDKVMSYEEANTLADSVRPDEHNIIFLPYLYGGCDDAKAKAAFVGIDSYHTRAHMLRAVYEGITFCHRTHIDRLLKNRASTDAVRIAGGVVNSPMWVQMFADVLGLRVETIQSNELGALGAAMTAAVAAGEYGDLQEAAKAMVKPGRIFEPNPQLRAIYEKKYRSYCKAEAMLQSFWDSDD